MIPIDHYERPRVALVTGASGGIGREIAVGLAADGFGVVGVHYRDDAVGAAETAEAVRVAGGEAVLLPADLASDAPRKAAALADTFLTEVRRLAGVDTVTALVNNAGMNGAQALGAIDEATFRRVVELDLTAPLFLIQALTPHFPDGGRVVNVSTGYTRIAAPTHVAYTAAKSALNGITLALAPTLARHGVTINAVLPGVVETGINADWIDAPGAREQAAAMSAFGRLGQPADVASLVRYLVSPVAAWTTGQAIDVTGGTAL
jgi:NAD(P)-dependent dehydrogenase (short-subunit alcohol dehydrogenase family)